MQLLTLCISPVIHTLQLVLLLLLIGAANALVPIQLFSAGKAAAYQPTANPAASSPNCGADP